MNRLIILSASIIALAGPAAAQGHSGGHAAGAATGSGAAMPPMNQPTTPPGADMSASRTQQRGAADVLPNTSASPTGVEHGSMSSTRAASAAKSGTDTSTTTGFAASTIVKDSTGATVGRVVKSTTSADGVEQVVLQIGSDTVTVPASSLTKSGAYATTTSSKSDLQALARKH